MDMRGAFEKVARLAAAACLAVALAGAAAAQGLFSPVLIVNDTLVTRYELDQRVQFLTLLGATANTRELALNQLTVEALQLETAAAAGFTPSTEAIEAGQSEFAARANLSREQFIAALGQRGVDPATFRDFIAAGVAWRAYVQDRFRSQAGFAPSTIVNRALETADLEPGRRVLLTEIVLPASTPASRRVSLERARRFSRISSAEAFSEAARSYSQVPSRLSGGEVDWRMVDDLPPIVAAAVRPLRPGQATGPVDLGNGIAVFYVRDVEMTPSTEPRFASVDYLVLQLPAGAESEAARIAASLERCEDIYTYSGRYPEQALSRQTTLLSALPQDAARVIAGLDSGEASIALTRGGAPTVLMVCNRTFGEGTSLDVARLRLGLTNEKLQILAAAHLNDIRARAIIRRPEG